MKYDFTMDGIRHQAHNHYPVPEGTDPYGYRSAYVVDKEGPQICNRCADPYPCDYRIQFDEWNMFCISMQERLLDDNLVSESKSKNTPEPKPWWEILGD